MFVKPEGSLRLALVEGGMEEGNAEEQFLRMGSLFFVEFVKLILLNDVLQLDCILLYTSNGFLTQFDAVVQDLGGPGLHGLPSDPESELGVYSDLLFFVFVIVFFFLFLLLGFTGLHESGCLENTCFKVLEEVGILVAVLKYNPLSFLSCSADTFV